MSGLPMRWLSRDAAELVRRRVEVCNALVAQEIDRAGAGPGGRLSPLTVVVGIDREGAYLTFGHDAPARLVAASVQHLKRQFGFADKGRDRTDWYPGNACGRYHLPLWKGRIEAQAEREKPVMVAG